MGDRITRAIEEALRESGAGTGGNAEKRAASPGKPRSRKPIGRKPAQREFALSGLPMMNLKWDDLGLGLIQSMGFVSSRSVQIAFTKGTWSVTGAYASSTVIYFLLASGGAIIYFLRDLLGLVEDWSWIGSVLVIAIPMILNLFIRPRTYKFQPYEVEMLAYDSESRILVLSTITQPGGVVAIRLDLPSDERMRKLEEAKIIELLKSAHTGFTRIDGMAEMDTSKLKTWSLWGFVWALIGALYFFYF